MSFIFEGTALLINIALLHYYMKMAEWFESEVPAVYIHHSLFLDNYKVLQGCFFCALVVDTFIA